MFHGDKLPSSEKSGKVVIGSTIINKSFIAVSYLYFCYADHEVSVLLGDVLTGAFYAWDTRRMRLIDHSDRLTPFSAPQAHDIEKHKVEKNKDDVVKVATEED